MLGLDRLTGQDSLKKLLLGSIHSGRVSHAYIFEGESGMGKTTLAKAFATQLVCENKTGCGNCPHCRLAQSGNHPDIITVTPTNGKQTISVDNIRALYESVMMKPHSADKKVIIIPASERLGAPAQNALLKMLEEPPSYVVFILLTSNSNFFLDTVLSRSLKVTLEPYSDLEIRSILDENGFTHVPDAIISCSNGNPGKALSLLSGGTFLKLRNELSEKFDLFFENGPEMFELVSYIEENKDFADDIFDIYLSFAYALTMHHIGKESVGFSDDFSPEKYIDKTTFKGCMAFLNKVIETKKMLLSNVNFSLLANSFVWGSKEVLGW